VAVDMASKKKTLTAISHKSKFAANGNIRQIAEKLLVRLYKQII
jgi:hypothetical protein